MQESPLVSILINNYNYGRFLDDSMSSATGQTYPNVEIIVVDDGSTDNSRDILAKYEGRAKIIYKENGGQASAFNAGFAQSRGDIICFLDSDDMYTPLKVQEIVAFFQKNPEAGYCFDKVVHTDADMKPLKEENRSGTAHNTDYRAAMRGGSLQGKLVMQIPATSGLSFRRKVLEGIFPIAESESCSMCENYMKYIAVGTETGGFLETSLTLQRLHGSNLFTVKDKDPSLSARISILTGYWLYKNFPELARFADTQIALGVYLMFRAKNKIDQRYKDYVCEYMSSRGVVASVMIGLRAAYYGLRHCLKGSK